MSQRRLTTARIVVLGGSGVGKSAFVVRYITKRYIGDYELNTEKLYTHKVTSARGDDITLEIMDTAYQCPMDVLEGHIQWADGVVLMYSVTDRQGFGHMCELKKLIYKLRNVDIPIVIVANKCDLLTARAVTEDEGTLVAQDVDCPKYELSVAESAQYVLEAMEELLRQIIREHVKSMTSFAHGPGVEHGKKSKLTNMKNAFKRRIGRSRSDTF